MNINTGQVYLSKAEALEAGEDPRDIVEILASLDQVEELSRRVKLGEKELAKREARKAMQRESRRQNR